MNDKTLTAILEEIKAIKKALTNVVTKDEAKAFLTKEDVKNFATKDDLKRFATKDDIRKIKQQLHQKIKHDIDSAVVQIVGIVGKHKADTTDVEQLKSRVTRLEHKIAA